MGDQKRGKDAQDEAAKPHPEKAPPASPGEQDAPNYRDRKDEGQAIAVGDMSSANDE